MTKSVFVRVVHLPMSWMVAIDLVPFSNRTANLSGQGALLATVVENSNKSQKVGIDP